MIRVRQGLCVSALALAFAVAGCNKNVPPPAPAPPPPAPAAPAPPPPPPRPAPAPPPAPAPLTEEQIFQQKSLAQLNDERPLADVYFDLDMATLREDAKPILQRNADWMKRWTSTQITVEGHCDE